MTPHYNGCHPNIKLLHQWRDDIPSDNVAQPGQIICTVDERADAWHYQEKTQEEKARMAESRHRDLIHRQVIYMQIARFSYRKEFLRTNCADPASVHALLLEPIGQNVSQYRRVGTAEIPQDTGVGDGWKFGTITII
jgi:hypothetical protein